MSLKGALADGIFLQQVGCWEKRTVPQRAPKDFQIVELDSSISSIEQTLTYILGPTLERSLGTESGAGGTGVPTSAGECVGEAS